MRILVTGAAGQLGTDLMAAGSASNDTMVGLDRSQLDITDRDAVHRCIAEYSPDLVINSAAWTAVDLCEGDPERAELVNGTAVDYLASAVADIGAHLVQISTDYVFDGTKVGPYVETDAPNPQSSYGRSKLSGEEAATAIGGSVIRTSWVCSAHGGNMVATILRLADEHPTLRFVSDQRGHPTFTADLAPVVLQVGRDRVDATLHITNAGAVSWFEFAQAVLDAAGYDPARVEPVTTAELKPPRPAARPANSVLANRAFEAMGYPPMRDFKAPLADAVGAYL